MNVFIRADASETIGTGHVFRCLALAAELRRQGARVVFLCRELTGHMITRIRALGYEAAALGDAASADGWLADAKRTVACLKAAGERVDWLIVDHYGLDWRYESFVKEHGGVGGVLVIDDLANRSHRCELLLDQNYYRDAARRYAEWVGVGCRLLLGPRYALLRPEFAELRRRVRKAGPLRRVLVSFGGADRSGATLAAVRGLAPLAREGLRLTVVAGRLNPDAERLERLCAELPGADCIRHTDRLGERMLEADLAVGAGGTTTWERCCLGLPSLIVAIADNQLELAEQVAAAGAARYLGRADEVEPGDIGEEVRRWMEDEAGLACMSRRAMAMTEGDGAGVVAGELCSGLGLGRGLAQSSGPAGFGSALSNRRNEP